MHMRLHIHAHTQHKYTHTHVPCTGDSTLTFLSPVHRHSYAMNYGGVYVASVALDASHAQAVRAFKEADAFPGPSIIISYSPNDVASLVEAERRAVDAGNWPLYRWNPHMEEAPFALDSRKLRDDLKDFVQRDNQLAMMVQARPKLDAMQSSVEQGVHDSHASLAKSSGGAKKIDLTLLVLYGSDSGNGSTLAEKLQKKAHFRGVIDSRCQEASSVLPEDLTGEEAIVFVMSTAGQGEMCGNAKEFYSSLQKSKVNLKAQKVAVFGLGDSAYWGKGTADSAKYFCKPAKDLEAKLRDLGAQVIVPVGLGDDQADNGYGGEWEPWQDAVFEALGVKAVAGEDEVTGKVMVDDDVKVNSNYLRGHILISLADKSTAAILPEDAKLTKFHGIYQQDNRDERPGRAERNEERAYSFMVRVGIPGGVCTSAQYLVMDQLCDSHANGEQRPDGQSTCVGRGIVCAIAMLLSCDGAVPHIWKITPPKFFPASPCATMQAPSS